MGRPPKLTPDGERRIMEALAAGSSRRAAAIHGGISPRAMLDYLARGREAEDQGRNDRYSRFLRSVNEAETRCEIAMTARWVDATKRDWRAARDWLARRHPDDWAPIEKHDAVAITVGGAAIVDDPDALRLARELRDRLAERHRDQHAADR
jgi:hypothetical protein